MARCRGEEVTRCPECSVETTRSVRSVTWKYRGHAYPYMQPGLCCTSCDNTGLSDQGMMATNGGPVAFRAHGDLAAHIYS